MTLERLINDDNLLHDWKAEHQAVTKCICHKGFSKYSSIVARSNLRVSGQETTPQTLTAHTLNR